MNELSVAVNYHQAGELENASTAYSKIIESNPRNYVALGYLGIIKLQQSRLTDALQLLDASNSLNSSQAIIWSNRAACLHALGNLEAAQTSYARAHIADPSDMLVLFNRGVLLEQLGRLPEAASCFTSLLSAQPDHAEARLKAGVLSHLIG
jgi:tetratricopeptide (TPR) repeat protein